MAPPHMIPTTLPKPEAQAAVRPLSDAYIELLLQGAQADPAFGPIALARTHDDDTLQPLHRGCIKVLFTLSSTADEESITALTESLRDLYEVPWLTTVQVGTLLELAARPADLNFAEIQARAITLASDGRAELEAYGARICFERDWWAITGQGGQKSANCPRLESAIWHARLQHLHARAHR